MYTNRYNELKQQYESISDERTRIGMLIEMAMEVRNLDLDHAIEIAHDVIRRAEKAGYPLGIGRGNNLLGWCYWQHGNYDEGIKVLEQAYSIAQEIHNRPLEGRVLSNFGYIYRDRGDLASALSCFERALAINEELNDEVSRSVNLSSIAYLNYDLEDYETALEFALKCLPIIEQANDVIRLTNLYQILGNIYFKLDKLNEAFRYFEETLRRTEPDTALHVLAIANLGKVYYKMNDFANARDYLQRALGRSQGLGNVEVQIICHFYLGRLLMDEGDYRLALKEMSTALQLSEGYMRRHDLMSVHGALSELYDKMGDIPKAFHHLKTYETVKEEIFKQTTYNKLRNLQTRQEVALAQKEKEVAERTAHLKQQFMANMSHEIRTPMNAIVGMTGLLASKDPRPDQMRYLQAIRQSADNLLVIINDILDLSKIESGKIIIEETDFSLREVARSMRDMLMLKAEEKNIDLRLHLDPALPDYLLGDPTRVNQVLINLVGNAIKFTEKGYVAVNISLQKKEQDRFFVQMDVTDTGIGIAADYVEKIFESFTQAGTNTARKYGGTGLGLTISRQLVTLMHGTIGVQSEPGEGTTFTVVIPFPEGTAPSESRGHGVVDDQALARLGKTTVLLAEDNEFNRMVAEDTLKELIPGISVEIAVNGQEAVDRARTGRYDVILMDIQMPVMDGVAATRAIRETLPPPANAVKIIAMTANVLQEDVKLYLETGMDAYVSKPFRTEELLLQMTSVLGYNGAEKSPAQEQRKPAAPEAAPEPEAPALPEKVTDMAFLERFAGGNREKMGKYIRMFLDNAPGLLRNIEERLAEKDFPGIKIAAHSLKPQLSYMGVKEEISHIFLIEQTASEAGHSDRLPPLIRNLKNVCGKAFEELQQSGL